jgi:hypothetical protein
MAFAGLAMADCGSACHRKRALPACGVQLCAALFNVIDRLPLRNE